MVPAVVVLAALAGVQSQFAVGDPEYEGTVLAAGRAVGPPQPLSLWPGGDHPGFARRSSHVSAADEVAGGGPGRRGGPPSGPASVKSLRSSSSLPPGGVGLVIQLPWNWLGSRNAVSNHAGWLHGESLPALSRTRACQ